MHTVIIELLRTGEAHNHGLSPETKYIALCGSHPPVDVTVKCDQETFSKYKQMLRYYDTDEKSRQEGIKFFEDIITGLLDDIEPLRIEGQTEDILHVRLVTTPKELAQLPFELSLTPEGFPGWHSTRFFMNPRRLTTLTREVRQVGSARYLWPHKPRILFAWASPEIEVPYNDHYDMLKDVVKDFASPKKESAEPIPDFESIITILEKASLKSINEAVRVSLKQDPHHPYTHIHLLAHGAKDESSEYEEYKLVLHDDNDPDKSVYISGNELAYALIETENKETFIPAVVSMMACDSSNTGSISLPGGSLAHQLHESGIPCVFASQFPLSKKGSVKLVSVLYNSLISESNDPREALYFTRKVLADNKIHDWASLVAYARFPEDIDLQMKVNRLKKMLEEIKTANKWAEHLFRHKDLINQEKMEEESEKINLRLDKSIKDLKELFSEETNGDRTDYSEHFGLLGSAFKRKAENLFRMAECKKEQGESSYDESLKALKESRQWYFKGYDKQKNHWNASQYLSITSVIKGTVEEQKDKDIWTVAKILAEDDTRESKKPMKRIWAWGTLAELYLLLPLTMQPDHPGYINEKSSALIKALEYIDKIVTAKYDFADDTSVREDEIIFARESTRRQIERYIVWWPVFMNENQSSAEYLKVAANQLLERFSA